MCDLIYVYFFTVALPRFFFSSQRSKVLSRIEKFSFADRKVQALPAFFFLASWSKVLSRIEKFSFANRKVQALPRFFFRNNCDNYRTRVII